MVSVLTLLAELDDARHALARRLSERPERTLGATVLRDAGVLPVPAARRRPASVLDHREEGPDGQFALV
ncbi:hypothetical protein SCOCK_820002 [Actinacidiphila cocklensis]|uniref:Uncharacterized protein n=1 Tax=Actinacidiphila cocklensis TaxID=887465 RepID=A0A9W4EBQ7_9ACTN|nr:hypothetical protein SCOCK_820002 [Actinacidiphila cocklensis]